MTQAEAKWTVRQRDGHKCVECGATSDDFPDADRDQLEVHRIIPGSVYTPEFCVLLCKPCHSKKPKSALDVICDGDPKVKILIVNLYNREESCFWSSIESRAAEHGLSTPHYVEKVLREHCKSPDVLDYVI